MAPLPTEEIFNEFDAKVDRLLTERRREPVAEPKDLLARLLAARDSETGGAMTGKEVRDQVVTIFMAGHETTSLALSWTWYLLSQHPVEAKVYNGLRDVLGGRAPEYADVANLRYTRMVIGTHAPLSACAHHRTSADRAGRDSRPSYSGRRRSADHAVALTSQAAAVGKSGQLRPERFLPERVAERPRFAYMPFGAGRA